MESVTLALSLGGPQGVYQEHWKARSEAGGSLSVIQGENPGKVDGGHVRGRMRHPICSVSSKGWEGDWGHAWQAQGGRLWLRVVKSSLGVSAKGRGSSLLEEFRQAGLLQPLGMGVGRTTQGWVWQWWDYIGSFEKTNLCLPFETCCVCVRITAELV